MKIKVGVRKPIYPEWVDDAIRKLPDDSRNQIVKCVIYSLMEPTTNGVKIHSTLQKLSNRIPILPSITDALTALMIAEPIMAWHISKTSKDKIKYET